VFSQVGSAIQ